MRPVVEGMGLDWSAQRAKLASQHARFNSGDITTVGADGRQREMTCIPLRCYPMWLATINPAKVPNPAVWQQPLGNRQGVQRRSTSVRLGLERATGV